MNGLKQHTAKIIVWAILLTIPYWFTYVGGYLGLANEIVIYALAAMALNFLLGFTGVLSFGHAAFFGLGAYGTALTIKFLVPSTLVGLAVGVLTATLAGMVIGALIIKRRGVYFAMATIAFGQLFFFIANRWNSVTGGDDGVGNWHRMPINLGFTSIPLFHNSLVYYYFTLLMFALAVGAMGLLLDGPFGRSLMAIRENERRARFLGINVELHVWISFVISTAICGLAGGMLALLDNFVNPRDLRFDLSGVLVIMAVMGGMRSFWGPLLGAAIFQWLREVLSSHTPNWQTYIGIVFVLVVLFFRRGILGFKLSAVKS